jgi:hypothetical protein
MPWSGDLAEVAIARDPTARGCTLIYVCESRSALRRNLAADRLQRAEPPRSRP